MPRELMYILSMLSTLRTEMVDSVLKHVKKIDQRKKEAKEKGVWIPPKHEPGARREAHCVRADGESLSCGHPFPVDSWHDRYQRIEDCTVKNKIKNKKN